MTSNDEYDVLSIVLDNSFNQPSYALSGSGWGWFYDPDERVMVRVPLGTECIPFSFSTGSDGKIPIRITSRTLLVNKDEIIEIGWN